MFIESLIQREGGSKITMPATNALPKGKEYHFKAHVVDGPHIAEVSEKAHQTAFIRIVEGYTIADAPDEGQDVGDKAAPVTAANAAETGAAAPADTGSKNSEEWEAAAAKLLALTGKPPRSNTSLDVLLSKVEAAEEEATAPDAAPDAAETEVKPEEA